MTAATLERAAEPVDDERRQGLAFDIFGDDQQRLAGVDHRFQQRDHFLDVRDLLLVDEDVAIFEHALHRLRIGDEVRREIAAVELHALDPLDLGLEALAFIDGDDAVLADLLHRLGQQLADLRVVVRGDGGDLGHLLLALDGDRHLLELLGDVGHGPLDAVLHLHGIDARDDRPQPFVEDRFGEHGGGGGAVAGDVARLRGNFADHPGAHVFIDVFEVDFLGHGHAVLGDGRRAEAFLENDVAALGAERHLDGPGQLGNAPTHRIAGFLIESNHLCHGIGSWRLVSCSWLVVRFGGYARS